MSDAAWTGSTVARLYRRLRAWLALALERSLCRRLARHTAPRFQTATDRSRVVDRLAAIGATGRRYVRSSFLYRWLTTEPDPDVIVIDLRETYTVGPVIRLLDRVVNALAVGASSSRTVATVRTAADATRARPIRVASLAVLPVVGLTLVATVVVGSSSPVVLAIQLAIALAAAVGLRSRRSLEDLLETRVARLLVAAFEPPSPPERGPELETRGDGETDCDESDTR